MSHPVRVRGLKLNRHIIPIKRQGSHPVRVRGLKLVMDNLGISAAELQKEVGKVGDFGKAAGNIIRSELTSMGDVADTTATKVASIKTSFQNLKTGIGFKINESPLFQGISNWVANIGKFLQQPNTGLGKAIFGATFMAKDLNKILDEETVTVTETSKATEKHTKTIADLRQEIENYKAALEEVSITDNKHRLEILQKTYALEKQLEALTTLKTQIEKLEKLPTGQIKPSVSGGPITGPGLQGIDVTATSGEQARANIQAMTEELQNQQLEVDILASGFDALFSSVDGGFKAMVESIIGSIKRLIAELLARAAVLTILNILTGGGAKFGSIIKTAASSMGITKMASGGVVPPGYPNDTFPAMLSSGEKVIPKGSAGRFGEKINVEVTGTILNRDINISGRRAQREN